MLVLVYVCNFVDRLIISILAEDIKAELHVSDSQLGFIAGTAFAVFYALFGLPLGRLADIWIRKRLIAIGLALWSALTVLSGTAASFLQLAVYRCGVGIGEARLGAGRPGVARARVPIAEELQPGHAEDLGGALQLGHPGRSQSL